MANGVWRRLWESSADRSRGRRAHALTGSAAEAAGARASPPASVVASYGAGWYASSWDLHRGLEVLEGLPADARPDETLTAYFLMEGVAS